MPDNPIPQASQQAEEVIEDVSDALGKLPELISQLSEHVGKLVEHVGKLQPIQAAAEIPAAGKDVVLDAGNAAGDVAHAGGHAVATVPAVATDVLDTGGQTAGGAVRKVTRYTIRKRRK